MVFEDFLLSVGLWIFLALTHLPLVSQKSHSSYDSKLNLLFGSDI